MVSVFIERVCLDGNEFGLNLSTERILDTLKNADVSASKINIPEESQVVSYFRMITLDPYSPYSLKSTWAYEMDSLRTFVLHSSSNFHVLLKGRRFN